MEISGIACRISLIHSGNKVSHKAIRAPMLMLPRNRLGKPMSCRACSSVNSKDLACGKKRRPGKVKVAPERLRTNSVTPKYASRRWIRVLTVDCVTYRRLAASRKLPLAATLKKVRI